MSARAHSRYASAASGDSGWSSATRRQSATERACSTRAAQQLHSAHQARASGGEVAAREYDQALAAYREVCDLCASTWYGALGDGDASGGEPSSL